MSSSVENQTKDPIDSEKDQLEEMLDRTGCRKVHEELSECMYESRDWRKCQHLVKNLRDCMLEYEKRKSQQEFANKKQ